MGSTLAPQAFTNRSTALENITSLVKGDLATVNGVIIQEMQSEIDFIPQLASHLISAGGKRVRPVLTLASASLCGYTGQKHIDLAACVEFIHTATLLHDDVVDESNMRRGQPSANVLWGNQASVLVGDFLFSRAFQLMVRVGHLEALGVLAKTSAILAEGEVMQLMDNGNLDIVEQRYFDIIRSKTASLFKASCEVGAMISEASPEKIKALGEYGAAFGSCFQIIDDVLDYAAKGRELGKNIGDDFREGKVTLPVIYAYHQGNTEEKAFWERVFEQNNLDQRELTQAQAYLLKHKAFDHARHKAQIFATQAKKALTIFDPTPLKTALLDLVDLCLERGY